MALPAALYDFQVELHHVDRSIEQQLQLKVARHPSETLERVWLRVLAYCWCWDERLSFGPGLSDPEAPDLISTDYTGEVTQWIRVGKADAEKVRKVIDHNPKAAVTILFDAPDRLREFELARPGRLRVAAVAPSFLRELAGVDERRAKLTLTIVGDHLYLERAGKTLEAPLQAVAEP